MDQPGQTNNPNSASNSQSAPANQQSPSGQAAAPVKLAPVPPPQPGTPPVAPSEGAVQNKKSKAPLIIFIILGIIVGVFVVAIVYNAVSRLRSNKATTTTSQSVQSSLSTNASINTCGVELKKYNDDDEKGHITADRFPQGFQMWDAGGEDSIREYCEGAKLKERAEGFIAALSDHNWDTAYTYLSKDATSVSIQKKKADWTAEYGSYTFPPSNWPYYDAEGAKNDPPYYVIEPCRKEYGAGWTKEMKTGSYRTPFLMLNKEKGVSTTIFLLMSLEDGVWKVAGENNKLNNATGILNADAYSNAQGDRAFTNPFDCAQ